MTFWHVLYIKMVINQHRRYSTSTPNNMSTVPFMWAENNVLNIHVHSVMQIADFVTVLSDY